MKQTLRTVVVDDSADIRALIRYALSSDDLFTLVAEASNGVDGLRVVLETAPDLVLLDLAMPLMDGLEFLEELGPRLPATSVVVLSGFPAESVAHQSALSRAAGYIQKNDLPAKLGTRLREVLNGSTP